MSWDPPEIEPTHQQAGEQWDWTRLGGEFPADEWTLSYALVKSDARIAISGGSVITVDGENYAVSVPAATTAAYGLGLYRWQAKLTNIADTAIIRVVDAGWLRVLADFSAAAYSSGYDYRSHPEKMLALIETALEAKAAGDVLSYGINGRSVTHYSWDELRRIRLAYRREVAALRRENRRRRGLTGTGQTRQSIGGLK